MDFKSEPLPFVPSPRGVAIPKAFLFNQQEPIESLIKSVVDKKEMPRRGSRELLAAYRLLPWVHAITHKVAHATASVNWRTYAVRDNRPRSHQAFLQNPSLQFSPDGQFQRSQLEALVASGDAVEITNHKLLTLLHSPNELMTGRTLRHLSFLHLDLVGNTLWVVIRKGLRGKPQQILPIPWTWVQEGPRPDDPFWKINTPGGALWQIPETEVIWIRDTNPENPFGAGVGQIEAMGDELDADENAAKHISSFFYNKAMPDALVSVRGITQEQAERAKAVWESQYRGWRNAYRTHWVGAEQLQVHRLDTSFKDQQLVDLRKFLRDLTTQVIGVPPEVMGITVNSNRATAQVAKELFAEFTLIPRLELLRTELQSKLVPYFDSRLILTYDNPIPMDRQFQLDVYKAAPWAPTVNEWRALGHLPARPDGDVRMIPLAAFTERSETGMVSVSGVDLGPSEPEDPDETEPEEMETPDEQALLPN